MDAYGLLPSDNFVMTTGRSADQAALPQAMWYFRDETIAVPKPGLPLAGFAGDLTMAQDLAAWAETNRPGGVPAYPPLVWVGSPLVERDVAQALERSPTNQNLGVESLSDMGSLMGQEGFGWRLHIVHAFGGIVAARQSMPFQESGRIYVQSIFWGPESDEGGSRERKKHMVFRSWKQWDPSTLRFTLFEPITGTYSLTE